MYYIYGVIYIEVLYNIFGQFHLHSFLGSPICIIRNSSSYTEQSCEILNSFNWVPNTVAAYWMLSNMIMKFGWQKRPSYSIISISRRLAFVIADSYIEGLELSSLGHHKYEHKLLRLIYTEIKFYKKCFMMRRGCIYCSWYIRLILLYSKLLY